MIMGFVYVYSQKKRQCVQYYILVRQAQQECDRNVANYDPCRVGFVQPIKVYALKVDYPGVRIVSLLSLVYCQDDICWSKGIATLIRNLGTRWSDGW
jgi:hypothetical protein